VVVHVDGDDWQTVELELICEVVELVLAVLVVAAVVGVEMMLGTAEWYGDSVSSKSKWYRVLVLPC
jgi:hypothetical protein